MLKSSFAAIAIFIASIFGGHQVAAPSQPAAAVVAVISNEIPSASTTGTAGSQSSPAIATTTIINQYITQPVIEHTIQTNTTQNLAQLQAQIAGLQVQISQLLNAQHPSYLSGAPAVQTFLGNTIPPLFSTLRAADIPTDIVAANYLPLAGGTLTGALFDSSTASSSFLGALGIGTTSPSDLFAVNGPIYLADISPSATANRLYSNGGSLYWFTTAGPQLSTQSNSTPLPSVSGSRRHAIDTRPSGTDKAPYLAALEASSCKAKPRFCAASGLSSTVGPSTRTCCVSAWGPDADRRRKYLI
jgi:hypothetical protein